MLFADREELRYTAEAMDNPQVGDLFTEMCAFWLYVIHRTGDRVVTLEINSGILPDEGKMTTQTVSEFKERFSYSTQSPGHYWIRLVRRGENVRGWYERCQELVT